MKRLLLVLSLGCMVWLAVTGCGGGKGAAPASQSGILGAVREEIEGGAVPLTPRPPVLEPLAGATISVQPAGGGNEIARVQSDQGGAFVLALPPGVYLLVPLRAGNFGLVLPPKQTVTVRSGQFTGVTLTYRLLAP